MARSTPPAAWHVDPEDAEQMRYWDGHQWTEHRQSRVLYLAEMQAAAARHSAHNTDTIKQIILFLLVMGLIVGVFAAVAVYGNNNS